MGDFNNSRRFNPDFDTNKIAAGFIMTNQIGYIMRLASMGVQYHELFSNAVQTLKSFLTPYHDKEFRDKFYQIDKIMRLVREKAAKENKDIHNLEIGAVHQIFGELICLIQRHSMGMEIDIVESEIPPVIRYYQDCDNDKERRAIEASVWKWIENKDNWKEADQVIKKAIKKRDKIIKEELEKKTRHLHFMRPEVFQTAGIKIEEVK